jgi:hypothetical protein
MFKKLFTLTTGASPTIPVISEIATVVAQSNRVKALLAALVFVIWSIGCFIYSTNQAEFTSCMTCNIHDASKFAEKNEE